MNIFISEEQYNIAKSNGISRTNVYNRVYNYGWSINKAITTELIPRSKRFAKRKYSEELIKETEERGICYGTFLSRISNGWSIEMASTTPIGCRRSSVS